MTYYIGKSVDTMVGKGQVNAAQLIKILGLLAGILLVTVLSQWLIQRLGNRVSYLSTTQLRKDAFAHLNQLPLSYYDKRHTEISSVALPTILTIFQWLARLSSTNYFLA